MIIDIILLIIWFFALIKWADLLVDWASSFAKKLWISSLVIWLTIVAFGTSAPELVVSIISWIQWKTELTISNVLWSNISNILLILGLTSVIYPIAMPKSTVKKEIPFVIFVSTIIILLLYDWELSRFDSMILLVFFIIFLYYTFTIAYQKTSIEEEEEEKKESESIKVFSTNKSIIFIIIWLTWLILWWKFIVNSAVNIASSFWLPESFIWVTIIAVWTSLPELAASIVAAFKKNTDMAIWWIVWSNIFNILWILWISSLISPLNWYEWMHIDLSIELIASIILFSSAFIFKKYIINRPEWFLFLIWYFSYIWYLIYSLN